MLKQLHTHLLLLLVAASLQQAACTLDSGAADAETAATLLTTRVGGDLDPDQPYTGRLSEPVTTIVEFSVVVTPPYHARVLKVWLPIPQTGDAQEISDSKLSAYPMQVEPRIGIEPMYGNKFAYFEFDRPEGAQIIRHTFRVKTWEVHWDLDPAQTRAVSSWPGEFDVYRRRVEPLAEERTFRTVLAEAGAGAEPASRLFGAMDWIDRGLSYDHVDASLQASALWAFDKRRGHCSDYHGLCQTMGRELGTPTRVTYGINLFPKNSPTHCKLEAYLPPYGWVSFDISETQRQIAGIGRDQKLTDEARRTLIAAAKKRLRSGFRDNTWMAWTRGTHYDLAPKASRPVKVVRTIYAEADGEPLPEPDPANDRKREFGWMTVHKYETDRNVTYPFTDNASLAGVR